MKKFFTFFLIILILFPFAGVKAQTELRLADRLSGRILIQVESYGRAWYVYPKDLARYYLQNGTEAYNLMRSLGLGISNKDLVQIPTEKGQFYNSKLLERVKGYILLQVEEHGEAWYVNPVNGLRYYLKDGETAYELMREFGLGITNADLRKILMNNQQITFDAAFDSVAYTAYDINDNVYIASSFGETILPLASLTKLMTALVFLDSAVDWEKEVTITKDIIDYPYYYVGADKSSEIDFKTGDTVKVKDLWVALLVASSNQAAAGLQEASGYTKDEFVNLMNEKAQSFGLKKTHFVDVSGLDAQNISTAKEMAVIAAQAFLKSKIAETTRIIDYTISTATDNECREIKVINRNAGLFRYDPDGVKTGYLVEAQRNLALMKGEQVIVILHAHSMKERNMIIEKFIN